MIIMIKNFFIASVLTIGICVVAHAGDDYIFAYPTDAAKAEGAKCFICMKQSGKDGRWCGVDDRCYTHTDFDYFDSNSCDKGDGVVLDGFHHQLSYYVLDKDKYLFVKNSSEIDFNNCLTEL